MPKTDVIIIGAGPSGLFAAFYVGMRDLTARIIDPMAEVGGQLSALYPDKFIYDIAGFPKIRAKELVRNLVEQVKPFDPIYTLEERAERLEPLDEDGFAVTTSSGRTYLSRAVIITAGVGAFEPRRIEAEGVARLEHKGLEYAVRDARAYAGQRLLIIGGGDSAVDWALTLKDLADQVTLIHRRETFRAHGATVNRLIAAAEAGELTILTPYELQAVLGEERVREAVIVDKKTGRVRNLDVDAVLVLTGYVSKLGPIAHWGLELEKNRIKVDTRMETNIPGVFAAGDITTYPGKIRLIAVGFGEAATAANHAAAFAHPRLRVDPGHSSDHPPEGRPSVARSSLDD
ncbi:FAD-dependent pyridine nucleotide-disulfide oxidoreductase [Oceanithermus profundus DSM 14977]|uniref:Ferredoxin--NADP reductase n=1 Tax=Oceanithermus profundus (strain DSM 14977 / NBRC 100410 / VKM B-2274 / 506) TaxID=670487 RepID=E4U4E1_OCEP5|nr:NAD(P)/FAD-dependent oxidoreductase [Oceanithermus profundus]ADR36344.1 FAD-dependent pyridine nucleotide-disulfide oxidoreductase [Oceanithermus profundus DSM 14977]